MRCTDILTNFHHLASSSSPDTDNLLTHEPRVRHSAILYGGICTIRLPKSLKRWALAAFCRFFLSFLCFSSFFLAYIHTSFAACRQSYLTICYFVHGEMFDVLEMMKFCSRYTLHQRTSVDTCRYMYVLGICLYLSGTSAVRNPYMSCLLLGYQLWGS